MTSQELLQTYIRQYRDSKRFELEVLPFVEESAVLFVRIERNFALINERDRVVEYLRRTRYSSKV